MTSTPVIVVGAGERGRALAEVVVRSPKLEVVENATRRPVDELIARRPDAAFVVALPPRSGLHAALALARAHRRALVEAPLSLDLADESLPEGATNVELAHGWVTLAGRRVVEQLARQKPISRAMLEVHGLPESTEGDLDEALWHALALVRRLFPTTELVSATRPRGRVMELALASGPTRVSTKVVATGASLHLTLEGPGLFAQWNLEDGVEKLAVRGALEQRSRPARPPAERAVAQLVEPVGETLVEAREVARLVRGTLDALAEPLPPGRRFLAHALRLARERPDALFDQLGLEGEAPDAPPAELAAMPEECDELWAFRAGLKPVVFLTRRPEEMDAALLRYGSAHVERRERRVQTGPQDAWIDRRDLGERHIEAYVSLDPALARRAAEVQAESDPTAQVKLLGELMGYPRCCVEAFQGQDDRANNTRNRYATWGRTRAASWPAELNNLVAMTVAFFPCRYDCEAATRWARRVDDELARVDPERASRRRVLRARPALYFDHERIVVFDGRMIDRHRVTYRAALLGQSSTPAFARFVGALGLGDTLAFDDHELAVWKGDERLFTLRRTDPALGFLAPFTAAE